MRAIKYIVLHCSATPLNTTVASIQRYWRTPKPKGCGWRDPGYHFIIKADGTVVNLHPIEKVSNGVGGYNSHSLHICYIGGRTKDDRTEAQKQAQYELVKRFKEQFPEAKILGHRDFPNVKKGCPQFDVKSWLREVHL